jgi:hypothetical protein
MPTPIMQVPSIHFLIRELRDAIPPDLHPAAAVTVRDFLAEAEVSDWPPDILRLLAYAAEKIADEMEYEAGKMVELFGPDDIEVDRYRALAERFKRWFHHVQTEESK